MTNLDSILKINDNFAKILDWEPIYIYVVSSNVLDYAKAFYCVDHKKLWKILKEMGIPDHLTCFLRKLYAGQEATVRTGHGTTDMEP